MAAADLLASARNDEGLPGPAAMAGYRKIVTSHPHKYGPAAQFRHCRSLRKTGNSMKAFDAYQELITSHRQTPQFSEALDRQFGIAMQSRSEKTGRTFGFVPPESGGRR